MGALSDLKKGLTNILIATDGSKFSDAAIDACRHITADAEKAHFKIISVVEFPVMVAADTFVGATAECYDRIESEGHLAAKEFVEAAAARLRALFPQATLDLTTQTIDGSPVRVIVEEAESWAADLIVIGSHGYNFWSRALLGSVSGSIVQNAACSVLVVRIPKESEELE